VVLPTRASPPRSSAWSVSARTHRRLPYFLVHWRAGEAHLRGDRRSRRGLPAGRYRQGGYLRDHPLVLDAFADRVEEIRTGDPAMNCQLCKYRTQIIATLGKSARRRPVITTTCAASAANGADHSLHTATIIITTKRW